MTLFKFHVARRLSDPIQCSACLNFYRAVVELSFKNRIEGPVVVLCPACIESFTASLTVVPADWLVPVKETEPADENKK